MDPHREGAGIGLKAPFQLHADTGNGQRGDTATVPLASAHPASEHGKHTSAEQ